MKPARATVCLLALLVASACGGASSQAESKQPAPLPPAPVNGTADGTAYGDAADQPVAARPAPGWSEGSPPSYPPYYGERPPAYSPYGVEIVSGDYRRLPTYYSGGRAYVMGSVGERYRIHVTNPTSRRVEAVVSVDGLDAVDGKTASYEDKRGYVILPYSDVTIEGFRTSLDQVATFRFSSVRDSYAGRKGQDRNVGVIGVAFFPERERPVRPPPPRPIISDDRPPRRSGESASPSKAPSAEGAGRAPADASPAPSAEARKDSAGGAYDSSRRGYDEPPSTRPGLGTEFGEQRYSSVHYSNFQRENPSRPSSIAEVRYNDREGLLALGIPVDRYYPYGPNDVSLRESAEPFPKTRFATPPPR